MIESKEQYELWQIQRDSIGQERVVELIEALREVARGAIYYKQEKRKFLLGMRDYDRDGGNLLDDALDALPDWITEE